MKRSMMLVMIVAAMVAAGCGRLRWKPSEQQQVTRETAAQVASAVDRHGLPPGTPAGRVLVKATREAAIDAGPPAEPVNIDDLIPDGTASEWAIRRNQVETLRAKASVFLRGLSGQIERLGELAGELQQADAPVLMDTLMAKLLAIAREGAGAVAMAGMIEVPDDPKITDAERHAAEAIADDLEDMAAAGAADAARRPGITDAAGEALEEAAWWHDQLIPILAALGLAVPPAVGVAIKRGRDLVKARKQRESQRRSGQQIILQNQAFMDSNVGKFKLVVGGRSTTVAAAFKAFLSAQDEETQQFVAQTLDAQK